MGLTQVKKDGLTWPMDGAVMDNLECSDSIIHSGDTNTKLRFPAADTFTVETAGSERFRIASDGKIGIGTTSPNTTLDVISSPLNAASVTTTTCKQLGLWINPGGNGDNTTGNIYNGIALSDGFAGLYGFDAGASAATGLGFFTGNNSAVAERLRITSDGKIGIGTTSPQVTGIHINGSSARLQLTDSTTGTGSGDGVIFGLNGDQDFFVNNRETDKKILFFTENTERMRISQDGEVAIGSDSAIAPLNVRAMTDGNLHVRPITSIHSGTGIGLDILNNDNSAVQDLAIRAVQTVFRNASSESMRIDSDGRLLINHTGNTAVQGTNAFLQIEGTGSGHEGALGIYANMASTEGAHLLFSKSRGTSAGSVTAVQSGDRVADIGFAAADGNDRAHLCAQIRAEIDNTPGTDDVPGRLTFRTTADGANNTTERMRLDSKGGCLIGSEAYSGGGSHPRLYIVGNNGRQVKIHNPDDETSCLQLTNDGTGQGDDNGAKIAMLGDSSLWIANDENSPVRIATNSSENMRIGSATDSVYCGNVIDNEISISSSSDSQVGCTFNGGNSIYYHIFAANNHNVVYVCRRTSDGSMVSFWQDTGHEGSISVSGSTVSYNGGHLSRWSQLDGISTTDKSTRPTIYQGTVMSNLDKMCEWKHADVLYKEGDDIPEGKAVGDVKEAAHTEDNQQLNMTKVSDTIGDKNIAGVFWTWDDEDDEYVNDFYIAMTGDMVIRVAGSVTVERGDLMESAGDGTAKPQADDIIRSKTIAKIASTVATATYPDGSKAYPCALMAC